MNIKTLQVGPICTNCYILYDETEKRCAVVDPGGEGGRVADAVKAAGCTPVCVFLTHGHTDHTDGVAEFLSRFPGLPVYIHRAEPVGSSELFSPLPAGFVHYGEGDEIAVGGLRVRVLHTPGHSEGSVTLQVEDVLFCGDTLFAGSCGRTDFPGGNVEKIIASLRRLGLLEGNYQVYPGHMEPSNLDRERSRNPYLIHALRQSR